MEKTNIWFDEFATEKDESNNPLSQFSTSQLKAELRQRKAERGINNLAHFQPKPHRTTKQEKRSKTKELDEIMVHGGMKYNCESCGNEWFMSLEIGVEDLGRNGRPHQASPFTILCDCGGRARDISGYVPLPDLRPLLPGMRYFAYDKSDRENACGIPSRLSKV